MAVKVRMRKSINDPLPISTQPLYALRRTHAREKGAGSRAYIILCKHNTRLSMGILIEITTHSTPVIFIIYIHSLQLAMKTWDYTGSAIRLQWNIKKDYIYPSYSKQTTPSQSLVSGHTAYLK